FVSRGTTMVVKAPPFLEDRTRFEANMPARVILYATPQGHKNTLFVMDFGTTVREGHAAFRLENKVVTTGTAVPTLKSHKEFLVSLDKWLKFAHDLTSPFFKCFVTKELMDQFEKSPAP